jgi:TolB protein
MTSRSPELSLGFGGNRLRLVALGVILVVAACTAPSAPSGQMPTTASPRPSTAPGGPTRPAVQPTGPITPAERSTLRGIVAYSTRDGDIWVMNANGTGRRRVTRSGRGFDFDPSLSPNGRSIVFRTSRGRYLRDPGGIGAEGIFVVDVRTRREHPVHPPRGGLFPSWSPDGRAIAFSTLQRDLNGESIHLVTPSGTNLRDLAEPEFNAVQEGLAWSPDSRRIAYSGHSGDGNWAIWTMNRDGSDRRQLTFPTPVVPRGSGGDHIGAWSPDGKQLVYSSWQSGDFDLFVMNADGSDVRQLTDWRRGDGAAAWLLSGQILFSHFSGDEPLPHWYMINPDGTNLRSLPWFYGAGDPLDWVQLR